jgi:Ni,Fe-hydrogenase III large subunit
MFMENFHNCDFFLWLYIKNLIFSAAVVDTDDLRQRITNKCEEINNSPGMLENVIDSIKRRVRLCMHESGGHITHLI